MWCMETTAMKQHLHSPKKDDKKLGQPDPETLGTTDPQEHMEGPVSSVMQKVKAEAEENAGKAGDNKDNMDRKKEKDE